MIARFVALVAGVGTVVGGAVAAAMHFLSWTTRIDALRRYVDYVPGGAYSSTLTVHWTAADGAHPAWWPLLPIGLGLGLGVGAVLGFALALAGMRIRRAARID